MPFCFGIAIYIVPFRDNLYAIKIIWVWLWFKKTSFIFISPVRCITSLPVLSLSLTLYHSLHWIICTNIEFPSPVSCVDSCFFCLCHSPWQFKHFMHLYKTNQNTSKFVLTMIVCVILLLSSILHIQQKKNWPIVLDI